MFKLLRKLLGLGITIAVVFVGLHFQVGGRPLKDYLVDFYKSAIVQEAIRQSKAVVMGYLQKDVAQEEGADLPMEKVSDADRQELEKALKDAHQK